MFLFTLLLIGNGVVEGIHFRDNIIDSLNAQKIKTSFTFLDGDADNWDMKNESQNTATIGQLELIGTQGYSRKKKESIFSAFLEQGANLREGSDSGDPQKLAPESLQCYCKFKKPKITTVPASRFNNLGEAPILTPPS